MGVCVCVSASEREREREDERGKWRIRRDKRNSKFSSFVSQSKSLFGGDHFCSTPKQPEMLEQTSW